MEQFQDRELLEAEYERRKARYTKLVEEVRFATDRALVSADIAASVSGRLKEKESFLEKVARKQYKEPFKQTPDLAGVRVVCQFTRDLALVEELLSKSFAVHERVDKKASLGLDRMGYLGTHFVIQLHENHKGPRYDDIRDLRCEVQVRTILQDAWAQIDHSLMYKAAVELPEPEKRELNNVSALLEVAQVIFDKANEARSSYQKTVEDTRSKPIEFLSQPIDRETLVTYTKHKFPGLPVNRRIQELLLSQLDATRYKTLGDIDKVVQAAAAAVEAYAQEAPDLFAAGTDYISKSVGFLDKDFRAKHGFASRTKSAFNRLAHLVGKTPDTLNLPKKGP